MIDFGLQCLAHGIGDYWLQNDYMALNKKKSWNIALLHAFVYTLPFLVLTRSIVALLIICLTHAYIDHTDIVQRLNRLKNWHFQKDAVFFLKQLGNGIAQKTTIELEDGYGDRPVFLRTWLIIIQDNILHLLINYISLYYFG